jgi:molecular chaperone GrpE (heat shock protein)
MNKAISERDGNKYPTAAEADTITKLANAIDKLESETGLNEILSTFKEFLNWLRKFNLEEAQRLVPVFDDFVKTKLK